MLLPRRRAMVLPRSRAMVLPRRRAMVLPRRRAMVAAEIDKLLELNRARVLIEARPFLLASIV